jgi:LysR family transcriptional regulator for bpeEF and oprC
MDKLKAMRIFAAVVDEGSMSAAARRLGVANSVVSKNLRELESWLGRKLIYRSTRSLKLSQEGQVYHQQIADILQKVTDLESSFQEDEEIISGTVKVTAPVILGKKTIAPLLPSFSLLYPGIHLNLVLNDDFSNMVEEGIDVALRVSRLPDSNFIARKLASAKLKLVSSLAYIEEQGAPHKPEALTQHQCLIDNSVSNAKRWNFVSPQDENLSVHIDGPIEVNNAESVLSICEAGMGIAQLPEFFVNDAIKQGTVVELLPEYALIFDVSLLYHQHGSSNPATKAFIDYVIEHATEEYFI